MQCSGNGSHLAASGKSRGFSLFAAGTLVIFLKYSRDVHSKLECGQRSQDTSAGMTDTSGM